MEINPELLNRDYTFVIDRSGSMARPVKTSDPRGLTRWKAVSESVYAAALKVNEFDPDGITVYHFSSVFQRFNNTTPEKVNQLFTNYEPDGGTDLTGVLKDVFFGKDGYFTRRKKGAVQPNGELVIIVTDGEPENKDAVKATIVEATKMIDNPKELALVFIQVGDDSVATNFLEQLDNNLTGAKYDIVSVISHSKMGEKKLADVLLDAILEHRINL